MRERWGRGAEALALTPLELTTLVQPAFPGQSVTTSDLASGLVNTNIRLELSAHPRPVLLRLYSRDRSLDAAPMPDVAAKEAALHRLLAQKLPVCWWQIYVEPVATVMASLIEDDVDDVVDAALWVVSGGTLDGGRRCLTLNGAAWGRAQ